MSSSAKPPYEGENSVILRPEECTIMELLCFLTCGKQI